MITNGADRELNEISKKKPYYKIIPDLRTYLLKYSREMRVPVSYNDLCHFRNATSVIDKSGNDTLWLNVLYDQSEMAEIYLGLRETYAMLTLDGDLSIIDHLIIDRVDYCTFGNSKPFRIRIVNTMNDNFAYFYIKQADASRVYGLEFEHILSPNKINFITDANTLIEEHIAGIPGDVFIDSIKENPDVNITRIAKEFIKFNERCFVRLLGDMRSYNYVVDITPDFEDIQYRFRAIDFDQQSFEGKKNMYLPQFFKENNPLVKLGMQLITPETAFQYQKEERVLIAKRLRSMRYRLKDLVDIMTTDNISNPEKVKQLREELAVHFNDKTFLKCRNMGEIVKKNLKVTLLKPMRLINRKDSQHSLLGYLTKPTN
ncbi:MAG: hypothetical protein AB8B61_04265 [Cyclobacteriaceae bacterium]